MTDNTREFGIWSKANRIVKELKDAGRFAVKREEIASRLDTTELDPDYCVNFTLNFAISCALWENHFRSVVKGRGVHADLDVLKNPDIRDQLLRNAIADASRRAEIVEMIQNLPIPESEGKQGAFTFDENGAPIFFDELSTNELLELLISLQRES